MKPIDIQPIGRRVAGKRTEHSLTQQQLADKAGITQRTVALIETGKRTGVSVGTLAAIAAELQVSLDYLVFGTSG